MKESVPDDCGNSPRKKFLVEFNRAFAQADVEFVLDHVSDDVVWSMVGSKELDGKAAMRDELASMMAAEASSMVLHSVITHGRDAAANGEFHYPDGEKIAFCDVYAFTKATGNTIRRITSYAFSVKP
ncbi:MAG: nuclear transport factor 2 family protein [Spirochaetota bacterium]